MGCARDGLRFLWTTLAMGCTVHVLRWPWSVMDIGWAGLVMDKSGHGLCWPWARLALAGLAIGFSGHGMAGHVVG
jgi:hypothetical protein